MKVTCIKNGAVADEFTDGKEYEVVATIGGRSVIKDDNHCHQHILVDEKAPPLSIKQDDAFNTEIGVGMFQRVE